MITNAREMAIKILMEIEANAAYSNIALKRNLNKCVLSDVDKKFTTELVYGVIRHKTKLDYVIKCYSTVKINKISNIVLNMLRTAIHQIIHLDKVPDSAICNETVELSKKYCHEAVIKFINALLRKIINEKSDIPYPDKTENPVKHLEVLYSHPEWFVKMFYYKKDFEFIRALCAANNDPPYVVARVNKLKTTTTELINMLKRELISARRGIYCDNAVIMESIGNVKNSEAFKLGYFQIQDESSMLVTRVLNPPGGDTIFDLCAGPGGKTTHLAEHMNNRGKVIAFDIHEHKLALINESAERLGLTNIETRIGDALIENPELFEGAHHVVLDAPCSGLGIIRRKPDIKWTKSPNDIEELAKIQLKMLENAAKYVKPSGSLIYSTCSVDSRENIDVIEAFLKNNPKFVMEDIEDNLPPHLRHHPSESSRVHGYIQIYPHTHIMDGFFICKLLKQRS